MFGEGVNLTPSKIVGKPIATRCIHLRTDAPVAFLFSCAVVGGVMAKVISILGVLIGVVLVIFLRPHLFSHEGSISISSAHAAAATLVDPTPTLSATQENDQEARVAAQQARRHSIR